MKISFLKLFLNFLVCLVSVWLLIHFLAFFGIFLFIFYPLWCFIFPKKSICLLCFFLKKEKKFCSHKNLKSYILSGFFILIFSLVSSLFVFFEYRFLFKTSIGFPEKSVSFVIPSKSQFGIDENFPVKVEISGIKTPINTVQADLKFDPNQLELVDISTSGSFANIFIQKEINNGIGYGRLTGGLPNPGFSQKQGIFCTFVFKGKISGIAKIEFLPTSLVLANDKKGTNVLKDFGTISYLITPQKKSGDIANKNVLGESTENDKTQMKFFEESNILGVETSQKNNNTTNSNQSQKLFFQNLENFDKLILYQWQKILQFF